MRPGIQSRLEPLVVSHGWGERYSDEASAFIGYHEWQGTRDLSAYLSVPAAIEFQTQHHWEQQRQRCHDLASQTRARVDALTGLRPICPDAPAWFGQMVSVRLPKEDPTLKDRLYDGFRIEVPIVTWNGQPFIRISFQAYNDQADADALVAALGRLLLRTT